jgi:hypothetical protein
MTTLGYKSTRSQESALTCSCARTTSPECSGTRRVWNEACNSARRFWPSTRNIPKLWFGMAGACYQGRRWRMRKETLLSGANSFQRGLKEMDDAKRFEPENIGVRIGRAPTLIGISQCGYGPADQPGRQLLESAASDCEQVLARQQPRFPNLAMHNRGELLFGLGSAWSMLGDQAKTRSYLNRITVDCRGSSYEQEARTNLEQKPIPVVKHECQGCHVH